MRVVDIHAHCVIPAAEEVIQGTGVEGDFPRGQMLGPHAHRRRWTNAASTTRC